MANPLSTQIFARNLRVLSAYRNLRNSDIAEAVGVSHEMISKWMNAKALPTVRHIQALAAFFNTDPVSLVSKNLFDCEEPDHDPDPNEERKAS